MQPQALVRDYTLYLPACGWAAWFGRSLDYVPLPWSCHRPSGRSAIALRRPELQRCYRPGCRRRH
mgnify:CR=1 FL=1